jgi:hypothetical protein
VLGATVKIKIIKDVHGIAFQQIPYILGLYMCKLKSQKNIRIAVISKGAWLYNNFTKELRVFL